MHNFQESLDFIVENSCKQHTSCSKCVLKNSCNCTAKYHVDRLQILVDRSTSKKAVTKDEVWPVYGENGAYVDATLVTHYHCPACGEWLSCDSAIDPDELECYCGNCGQAIKGVETEDED